MELRSCQCYRLSFRLKSKVEPNSAGHGDWQTFNKFGNYTKLGWSAPAIACQVGIGRASVFRYLRSSTWTERRGRSDCGRSLLDPYKDYLLQRWNDGCCEVLQLFGEIQQHGYLGSYDTVARYARRFRQAQGTQRPETAFY